MIQQSRTSINYVLTQVNKTKDKLPKQQQKVSIFTDWHSYSIPVITNANKTIANKSPTCQPTLCAESNSFWLSAGHWTLRGAFTTVNFHVYHMEDSVKNFKPPSVKYMYQAFFSFSHHDIKWCQVSLFCMHFHLSSDFLPHKSEFIPFFWKKYFKNFPRTSPGLILIFLGLQISPVTLSFQRFWCQFSLQSTFSSYMYNINSENFIVQFWADSQQFLGPVVSF